MSQHLLDSIIIFIFKFELFVEKCLLLCQLFDLLKNNFGQKVDFFWSHGALTSVTAALDHWSRREDGMGLCLSCHGFNDRWDHQVVTRSVSWARIFAWVAIKGSFNCWHHWSVVLLWSLSSFLELLYSHHALTGFLKGLIRLVFELLYFVVKWLFLSMCLGFFKL